MCGDGTNDVGGLKAAHIGVALLASSQVAENMRKAKEVWHRRWRLLEVNHLCWTASIVTAGFPLFFLYCRHPSR